MTKPVNSKIATLCQIEGLSCFGCCGNDYSHKKKLMRDIRKNTFEFKKINSVSSFMTRTTDLRPSGICANVVFKDGKFFCPGHPTLHSGRDYREIDPDCERDKDDGCKAYILFQKWNKEKQKQFLDFIKSKKLDSYTYSIKMDNDYLLKEFEKK
jgi:oligoribonuclease (3'-5' exoribonuclease)|tara:strand:- start:2168 stop:2629 length:462 start_codon:yes stop_codon:yes gene_type:complete